MSSSHKQYKMQESNKRCLVLVRSWPKLNCDVTSVKGAAMNTSLHLELLLHEILKWVGIRFPVSFRFVFTGFVSFLHRVNVIVLFCNRNFSEIPSSLLKRIWIWNRIGGWVETNLELESNLLNLGSDEFVWFLHALWNQRRR